MVAPIVTIKLSEVSFVRVITPPAESCKSLRVVSLVENRLGINQLLPNNFRSYRKLRRFLALGLNSDGSTCCMLVMEPPSVIQGREFSGEDLDLVRRLLREHPDWSQYRLSRETPHVHDQRAVKESTP